MNSLHRICIYNCESKANKMTDFRNKFYIARYKFDIYIYIYIVYIYRHIFVLEVWYK